MGEDWERGGKGVMVWRCLYVKEVEMVKEVESRVGKSGLKVAKPLSSKGIGFI